MGTCPKCLQSYGDDVPICEVDGFALLPDEACANLDEALEPGRAVGDYVIDEKVGDGGYGVVYSATHPLIGKRVAIKVLSRRCSADPLIVSRFIAEARAVNEIRHRNIVDIFTFGMLDSGVHYFVMELLEGETLADRLDRDGPFPIEAALPILNRIARALGAAHDVGIAHRDLKPDNVFLVDEDDVIVPKLLDFGVAKHFGSHPAAHQTETGASLGTPKYMSPEQCTGDEVDHRADIYAFGVLTHEMLTGRPPFEAERTLDLFIHHRSTPPPAMSSVNPEIAATMDAPVLAMLAKAPDARPETIVAAMAGLEGAAFDAGLEVSFSDRGSNLGRTPSSARRTASEKIIIASSGERTPQGRAAAPDATPGALGDVRPRRTAAGKTFMLVALLAVTAAAVVILDRSSTPSAEPAATDPTIAQAATSEAASATASTVATAVATATAPGVASALSSATAAVSASAKPAAHPNVRPPPRPTPNARPSPRPKAVIHDDLPNPFD